MTSMSKTISRTITRTLAVTLFSALMLVHPWAMAAGDTSSATVAGLSHCKAGTAKCELIKDSADHRPQLGRHGDCPRDSQDCDTRSKENRSRADHESRDRHACRD